MCRYSSKIMLTLLKLFNVHARFYTLRHTEIEFSFRNFIRKWGLLVTGTFKCNDCTVTLRIQSLKNNKCKYR